MYICIYIYIHIYIYIYIYCFFPQNGKTTTKKHGGVASMFASRSAPPFSRALARLREGKDLGEAVKAVCHKAVATDRGGIGRALAVARLLLFFFF